ncbi:MAG: NERD domain-containing protein [Burkholderiales bacterium]|nr:NERD domain-containing protein [Burkholderiales bacterium]
MGQTLAAAVPLLLTLGCFVAPMYLLLQTRKWQRRNRRSPLSAKLLRGPGETLRHELEDVTWDFCAYLAVLMVFPLLVFAVHVSQSYFGGVPETMTRWLFSGIAVVVAIGFITLRLYRLARLRFSLRHGLEAEIAMGQELDQLMREGAVVFHDFPAEGFNIDHVVLTRDGLYAVEIKGRMKPDRGGGKKESSVEFNGKVLSFPDWKDGKTLEQARRQAGWLAKWISRAVGEAVSVKPVVALPGWWVDRTGRGDVMVISGKEASALLRAGQGASYSDQMMARIAHQLEQRCRDVEPSQYGRQKKFERPVREAD